MICRLHGRETLRLWCSLGTLLFEVELGQPVFLAGLAGQQQCLSIQVVLEHFDLFLSKAVVFEILEFGAHPVVHLYQDLNVLV